MPFINIGSGSDLIVQLPTKRTQNWNDEYLTNFATPIAEHDHTGTGSGRLITTAAITADSVNGSKILLANLEYLKGRNAANSANINLIQVNASDKINIGADLANAALINDTYLGGRNNADSAYISMIKVNTSDKLATGADFANLAIINNAYLQARNNADSAYINILKIKTDDTLELVPNVSLTGELSLANYKVNINKTFTLADNQSAAVNITGATVTEVAGSSFKLEYSIYVDATTDLIEKGEASFSYDGTNWDQDRSYSHDDALVVFSIVSGQLKYTTPAYTGYVSATLTYQIIEL